MEILMNIRNVHIAIVINDKSWGAKGKGLETLASTAVSIITKIQKIKGSIFFVFNQYTDEAIEAIHANIIDKESQIQAAGTNAIDKQYRYFFTLMKQQTANQKEILRFYPLKEKPSEFYEKLSSGKKTITDMQGHLCSTIGGHLKKKIRDICDKYVENFKEQFENGRLNGAQFYLELLRYIAE